MPFSYSDMHDLFTCNVCSRFCAISAFVIAFAASILSDCESPCRHVGENINFEQTIRAKANH